MQQSIDYYPLFQVSSFPHNVHFSKTGKKAILHNACISLSLNKQ